MTTKTDERLGLPRLSRLRVSHHAVRASIGLAGMALLAGCAAGGGTGANEAGVGYSTDYYIDHAAGDYRPPGPPSDPWGPYIHIASERFDVPEQWIRQVMHVESNGQEYMNGQLTVSSAGAMGLMQLEPETYQEMASRYGLGSDPFNPYDNIMAGTAYIHEMYTIYGSPGFLAAYNAGPGRLDRFMNDGEPLPDQTQNYVAMIAPNIQGYYPQNRSQADQLALNTEPMGSAGGLLPPGFSTNPLPDSPDTPSPAAPVEVAAIDPAPSPDSDAYVPPPPAMVTAPVAPPATPDASVLATPAAEAPPAPTYAPPAPPPAPEHHFTLIAPAMADTPAPRYLDYTGSRWAIQVGAYTTRDNAKAALGIAELSAVANLMHGEPLVERINNGSTVRYRARFVNLPHEDAIDACHHLANGPTGCTILSPDAQG